MLRAIAMRGDSCDVTNRESGGAGRAGDCRRQRREDRKGCVAAGGLHGMFALRQMPCDRVGTRRDSRGVNCCRGIGSVDLSAARCPGIDGRMLWIEIGCDGGRCQRIAGEAALWLHGASELKGQPLAFAAEAQHDTRGQPQIVLAGVTAGGDRGEARHHVFGLDGAQGEEVGEANVETAPGRHGEGVLRGKRATSAAGATCNRDRAGMHSATQHLDEGGEAGIIAIRETGTTHIAVDGSVGVNGARLVRTSAGEFQLPRRIATKVADDPKVAIEIEGQRRTSAVQSNHPVTSCSKIAVESNAEAGVVQR